VTAHAQGSKSAWWRVLAQKDVLAGLFLIAVALLGLWLSRDYQIGTALRMGTGYVPRLLCWVLLGLGVIVLLQGLRAGAAEVGAFAEFWWRPFVFVPLSLLAFVYSIERLGAIIASALLIGVGALAGRNMRPLEVVATAAILIGLCWVIFIWGLALPISAWPEW
jgi:putative tricarboxylic transport membrane protein